MRCCWNEEKQRWYDIESIGVNRFRCLGCFKEMGETDEAIEEQRNDEEIERLKSELEGG